MAPRMGSLECGGEVSEEILEGLKTHGQPDQSRIDGERRVHRRRVGHSMGVLDQRLHRPEGFGQREK